MSTPVLDPIAPILRRLRWLLVVAYAAGGVLGALAVAVPERRGFALGSAGVGLYLGVQWWRALRTALARALEAQRRDAAWNAEVAREAAAAERLTPMNASVQTISDGHGFAK